MWQDVVMNTTLTVGKDGRVTLPKSLRDQLQITAGDALGLECSGDQIVLRPLRGTATMRKKRGVWVFRTGKGISNYSVNQTIGELREKRLDGPKQQS
jgi:AbrB family looped-hinge helix DNA binding protein